ncbi:uncharacterized protein [Spinacia oleracea]|uniref:Retrotransposon gag domain-containing protein n=1 Tax=Spinacia oleracea TaxID=3562 RepID=A0A9R0JEW5_SPIOL|nr:uncharacterized protein LOC110804564 [Spinacia oleracea]
MVQRSQFTGSRLESPREHLKTFVDYCSTVKHNGVTQEYICMALFKFSLIGNARKWLHDLKENSLTSWNEVTEAFINKYSSPVQTADYRSKMMTFKERTDETLQESWDRFNELIRQCPHHGIEMGVLLHFFYHGLSKASRTALDAGAGGPIMKKSLEEVFDIIDDVVRNCENWNDDRRKCDKKGGRYDLEPIHALSSKFNALVTQLQRSNSIPPCPPSPQSPSSVMSCALSYDYCGSFEHPSSYCYPFDQPMEQVNAFNNASNQRFDPYSNTYNPSWGHNPRFSWKDDQTQGQSSNFQRAPPQNYQSHGSYQGQSFSSSQFQRPPPPQSFQNPPPGFQRPLLNAPPPQESNIEAMLKTFMTQVNQKFDSMATHNKIFETQIAQLSSSNASRVPGYLPPQGVSPDEIHQANDIVTRSGKNLVNSTTKSLTQGESEPIDESEPIVDTTIDEEEVVVSETMGFEVPKRVVPPYKPKFPFPSRFAGANLDDQFAKFQEVLKNLYVNIPFAAALRQMPTYAKFLKEILTKKRVVDVVETISLPESCSAIIQNKLPTKLKDPGSFSIPCAIGEIFIDKALCDLGASVSVMPFSIFQRLIVRELKPTQVSLQLVVRSVKLPLGKVEDVPMRVGKFFIPVDFVVLEMEDDPNVPIILGRPFLATAGAILDVRGCRLSLSVGDGKIEFQLNQIMRCPSHMDDCKRIDILDEIVNESMSMHMHSTNDVLEYVLVHDPNECNSTMETQEMLLAMDYEEPLVSVETTKEVSKLELKPLPSTLKYAYLDDASPVIVNAKLNDEEISKLLNVLRKHKKAIGYSIGDLKGISPDFRMHRIVLEEGHKPSIEPQRILNPNMREVVWKEVVKLLDAGIIYPILDSKWVSPVQVVPKKGGMTVIKNNNDELIPTTVVTG